MNRRDLLKIGGAAAGLAAAPSLAAPVGVAGQTIALFDARFAPARRFAHAARQGGALALDTGGDIPSLWDRALPPAPLAGLTGYADMVVVAALAAQARRPVTVRLAHIVSDAAVDHRLLAGPASSLALLATAGADWPDACWALLSRGAPPPVRTPRPAAAPRATLWSWAIA